MRLNAWLGRAGVASRRGADELIKAGRVTVNGAPGQLNTFVAAGDRVELDGKPLGKQRLGYVLLNKPTGVVTTARDPGGRPTVVGLVDHPSRVVPVGRLDVDTTGALLLTNDGELAHRLAHPRYGVLKTYLAEVPGPLPRDLARRMTTGIELEDGTVIADRFRVVEQAGSRVLVEVTLHEGRKHVVRRMLAKVGHPVSRLVRTQVGPVSLGSLRPAATRRLTTAEVGNLYAAVGM